MAGEARCGGCEDGEAEGRADGVGERDGQVAIGLPEVASGAGPRRGESPKAARCASVRRTAIR